MMTKTENRTASEKRSSILSKKRFRLSPRDRLPLAHAPRVAYADRPQSARVPIALQPATFEHLYQCGCYFRSTYLHISNRRENSKFGQPCAISSAWILCFGAISRSPLRGSS